MFFFFVFFFYKVESYIVRANLVIDEINETFNLLLAIFSLSIVCKKTQINSLECLDSTCSCIYVRVNKQSQTPRKTAYVRIVF